MNILITNAYSARNKGDAAILLGMLSDLGQRPAFRDATFRISSASHPADQGAYPCEVVASFQSIAASLSTSPALRNLGFLALIVPWSLLWAWARRVLGRDLWAPASLRRLCRLYAAADLVVAAGGGYLYTRSRWRGNVVLLGQLYAFLYGAMLGKPVHLYAQSIGPFRAGFQSWIVRCALSRVRLVLVREDLSLQELESWRLQTPVHSTADAAFLLPDPAERWPALRGIGAGPLIGVTVRRWFQREADQRRFEGTMSRFVDWLAQTKDATVCFVPQVTYADGGDDDRIVARAIVAGVAAKDRVCLIDDELPPDRIKALCGAMDLFVGTRMHSNILAFSTGVPALAIGYQPKTLGIMRQLGMESHVCPIDGLALPALQRQFEALQREGDAIAAMLKQRIPELRLLALQNGERIEADYRKTSL